MDTDGNSYFRRYDEFAVSNEDDGYKISKLGAASGNIKNDFGYDQKKKYSSMIVITTLILVTVKNIIIILFLLALFVSA